MSEMNRREFLKGAGMGALGIAAASGLAGCANGSASNSSSSTNSLKGILPDTWDKETDVLVVGYGAAGANAAIAAAQAGVKTMVLEVAPEEYSGGNTSVAGGGFVQPNDIDVYVDYLYTCCFQQTDKKFLQDHAEALNGICDWLDSLGIGYKMDKENYGHWITTGDAPEVVSSLAGLTKSGVNHYTMLDEEGQGAPNGATVLRQFTNIIADLDVDIEYATRAQKLYQDPFTKEIKGLMATDANGNEINIKANKGVVLACGGFENSPELIDSYIRPGARIYPSGTPYNRGDGQLMAQEVGAKLWHMDGIEWQCYGIRPYASIKSDLDMAEDMTVSSHWNLDHKQIMVNRYGYRFFPEDRSMSHTKQFDGMDFLGYADEPNQMDDYKARWCYVIFDQSRYDDYADEGGAGELYAETFIGPTGSNGAMGWLAVRGLYHWDKDAAKELESGLLAKADTIEELCGKLGIEYVDNVKTTISNWNSYCDAGNDPEFHRDPTKMSKIEKAPFYGAVLYPCFINTQGGPVHNNKDCRVLDVRGNEIPRLYSTGECGSVYSLMYHGSGNIAEAIITGKNAAEDAAALDSWDA